MNDPNDLDLLLAEIDLLKGELELQSQWPNPILQQRLAIENSYHSNRLEGSSLDLRDTQTVITLGLMLPGKPMADNLAALNHYQAIQFIREQANDQSLLSEALLKQLHVILCRAIHRDHGGQYRVCPLHIPGGGPAPSPEQLPELIAEEMQWLRREGAFMHPVLYAAEAHLRLLLLQPFDEANGLSARLAMNLILLQADFPLIHIPSDADNCRAYYQALQQASGGAKSGWYYWLATRVMRDTQNVLARLQDQANAQ